MNNKRVVRLVDYIKKNKLSVAVISVVILTFVVNLSNILIKLGVNETISDKKKLLLEMIYIFGSLILSGIAVFLIRFIKRRELKYEKMFLILAFFLGVVYLLLAPMFTGSDEANHYYRIYELTDGVMVTPVEENSSGGDLPVSLTTTFVNGGGFAGNIKYVNVPEMIKVLLEKEKTMKYGYEEATFYANTSLYSPFSYLPHMIGFGIGKVFNMPPYVIGMLGRLFNLICYVVIGYFAIKIMPKWKLFFLLVLICPNMIQLASTLSADAFINAVLLLFIARIMNIRVNHIVMDYKKMVRLFVLGVVLALCKIVYIPFIVFLLLIPKEQFRSKVRGKVIFTIAVGVTATAFNLLWFSKTGAIIDAVYPRYALQKDYVLTSPIEYLIIVARTCIEYFVKNVEDLFVGSRMYHTQLMIPAVFSYFYVGLVIYALFSKEDEKVRFRLSKWERWVIILACVVVVGLILTALYVQCTASAYGVKYPIISGIQGRYFIPIIMCIPFIVRVKKKKKIDRNMMIGLATVSSLIVWFYMFNLFII